MSSVDLDKIAKKRLANKIIWALEDIDQGAINALALWDKALERAKLRCGDPALLLLLSHIRKELSDIRILAIAARQGEYAGRVHTEYDE